MPFPAVPLLDSPELQRYGVPQLVFGASPAVATDFSQAVLGANYARLISVFARLVTDANVANRQVVLEYDDAGGNRYALMGSAVVQAASLTIDYCFSAYQPAVVQLVDTSQLIPLQQQLLRPSDVWKLHIVNVQAGDQLSRIRFVWELFYSNVPAPGADPDQF